MKRGTPGLLAPLARLAPLPLALCLLFAPAVHAESLSQLYEMARAQDAAWQSARAQYEANLARAEQARAGVLPTVGAVRYSSASASVTPKSWSVTSVVSS